MKLVTTLLLGLIASQAWAEHYGVPVTKAKPVSLQVAIQQLQRKPTAHVVVESKVDKICEAKGCWLGLTSTAGDIRVTFKDYAFFVPPSLIGKTVIVEGTLEKITMSLDETKHYVKDAGGDPSTVTQPRIEYRIVASGVAVKS